MAKQTPKKEADDEQPLEGFEIHINAFGEIVSNRRLEEVNKFLDDHVPDKKRAFAAENQPPPADEPDLAGSEGQEEEQEEEHEQGSG